MNMITLIDNLNYVPGGGAIEEALALRVRKEAAKYPGREQLAMMAFAEALETIPRTLAENAGLEPVEILTELRSKQDKDGYGYGVDVFSGKVTDMFALGVIEPVKVKEQALKSSFEAAAMILRIDDVIAASRKKEEKGKEKPSETEFE
jgi:chaperonin GroEL (HSP60 family)